MERFVVLLFFILEAFTEFWVFVNRFFEVVVNSMKFATGLQPIS